MAKFNEEKTLAAILFLASQDGEIDLYALLKTLYYADKNHFQEWGRTITRDNYVRMDYGPVPSRTYDMLKSVRGDGFWPQDLSEFFRFKTRTTLEPLREPDMTRLSETDAEALRKSFAERGHKNFWQLKEEAHNDSAFKRSPDEWKMTEDDLAEDDPILMEQLKNIRENERFLENLRYLAPRDEEEIC
jgi:uncharacterized phage-associated protein